MIPENQENMPAETLMVTNEVEAVEVTPKEGGSQVGVAVLDRSEMPQDNAWMWWVIGGLVVIAIVAVVVVMFSKKNKKNAKKVEEETSEKPVDDVE